MKKLLSLMVLIAFVAGCSAPKSKAEKGSRVGAATGVAAGALLGQAIGGNTQATLIGAGIGLLVGGMAGHKIGKSMDQQEAALRKEFAAQEAANIQRNADILAVTFKSDVLFEVDSAALKPGAFDELSRVSRVLNQYPDTSIQIAGHTDSTGASEHNQQLSEQRAANVKNALAGEGVHPNRMSPIGFGESAPIADNSTEGGQQLNRRVVITIMPRNA